MRSRKSAAGTRSLERPDAVAGTRGAGVTAEPPAAVEPARGGGRGEPVPVLYIAPWVDYGGTAKGTVDWFRWLDAGRFTPSLITTQHPSPNRLLADVERYAREVWVLPELMTGDEMPRFICDFIDSRGIEVVHIMNSRLGFELLPDLRCLPKPPAVVVQLHVEEDTRRGYVKQVSTRYGNLVDAFSVSSRHLTDTMVREYDVERSKCRVIYTGVDAETEFNPKRVEPVPGLDQSLVQILFIGRLVAQKDPLLMLDVVAALAERRQDFRVQVVGYGEMEGAVREAVRKRRLGSRIIFQGPTSRPAGWYAACDLMLMTSVYEGVPYVLFEAMAMEVPTVAPALPGMVELMPPDAGVLVEDREDVTAYVEGLSALIDDVALRRRFGRRGRRLMRDRYSLVRMAHDHEELYEELIALRAPTAGMVV
jgi:glycosyltransferase involved in cell wall biosynthesis